MLRRSLAKAEAYLWSLVYEYRCAADWGADTGRIITLRINKWTKAIKVVEETVINGRSVSYRAA